MAVEITASGALTRSKPALEAPGRPLGMFADARYRCSLLVASDGVLDLLQGSDNAPKIERLAEVFGRALSRVGLVQAIGLAPDVCYPEDVTLLLEREKPS